MFAPEFGFLLPIVFIFSETMGVSINGFYELNIRISQIVSRFVTSVLPGIWKEVQFWGEG